MPNAHEYPTFFAGENLIGKALGLQFEVSNVPEEAVAYEIVRCRRTIDDRTVLMQGVIHISISIKVMNQIIVTDLEYRLDTQIRTYLLSMQKLILMEN